MKIPKNIALQYDGDVTCECSSLEASLCKYFHPGTTLRGVRCIWSTPQSVSLILCDPSHLREHDLLVDKICPHSRK